MPFERGHRKTLVVAITTTTANYSVTAVKIFRTPFLGKVFPLSISHDLSKNIPVYVVMGI